MEITMTTQLHPNREELLQETMSRIRSELVRQGRLARLEDYYDETPTDQLPKPPPLVSNNCKPVDVPLLIKQYSKYNLGYRRLGQIHHCGPQRIHDLLVQNNIPIRQRGLRIHPNLSKKLKTHLA